MSDDNLPDETWFDEPNDDEDGDVNISEYDITASPNDFNVKTIFDFIDSGALTIPGFQRNYVWDRKRASKLIESLIIGLPIPQVFLFQEGRNRFLVIDGQQRLMSIYYFVKGRFPRKTKRPELRRIFDEHAGIPADILNNDEYFERFNLQLSEQLPAHPNRFNRLNYTTLDEYKAIFDLRTVRNMIIKQAGSSDDSFIYEIFNRLNTGGVNLKPQEIRISLYHSRFYDMLYRVNALSAWRSLLAVGELDLHMKDIEILLRGFAMLMSGDSYNPSMVKFLNGFSRNCRSLDPDEIQYLEALFKSFLDACGSLPPKPFHGRKGKFNVLLFESVFAAVATRPYQAHALIAQQVNAFELEALQTDADFVAATQSRTAQSTNVSLRLAKAREKLSV